MGRSGRFKSFVLSMSTQATLPFAVNSFTVACNGSRHHCTPGPRFRRCATWDTFPAQSICPAGSPCRVALTPFD